MDNILSLGSIQSDYFNGEHPLYEKVQTVFLSNIKSNLNTLY